MDNLIGFIGLGRMGLPMAKNLTQKGFSLMVYDINEEPMQELATYQARMAKDVAEIAQNCATIITMLPDSNVVNEVIGGTEGVFTHSPSPRLIMDMSTIDPKTTDMLAEKAHMLGHGFVDAPVGRLASHADRGESLFMVGATDDQFSILKPMMEAMGSTIYHCGPVGSGVRTKLVNNFLAVASCQFNAEALSLAQSLGLNLEKTLDVIYGTTAFNGQLKIAWPDKVLAGDISPGFTIDLAHKDLSLVMNAAHDVRVPLPMGAAAFEAFSSARARGYGKADFSAMLDAHSSLAGHAAPRLKSSDEEA